MPVYEYRCDACEQEFEREQRISDDPLKTCPLCKSRRVKRLISRTSFVLKGGGWYSDLYSSQGESKKQPSDDTSSDAAPGSAESSGSAKGDDKPKKEKKKASTKKTSKKAAS
jgi:putative FmdB family regulatory protein